MLHALRGVRICSGTAEGGFMMLLKLIVNTTPFCSTNVYSSITASNIQNRRLTVLRSVHPPYNAAQLASRISREALPVVCALWYPTLL